MIFKKELQIKIVKTIECCIHDKDTSLTIWYDTELYILSNGKKVGVAYDQKGRCFPIEAPQYKLIFDCKWDRLKIINSEYSTYLAAFSGKMCSLFCLYGEKEIIEENEINHKNLFFITAKQV